MALKISQGSKGQVLVELLVIAIILAAFLRFFLIDGCHGFSDKAMREIAKQRFSSLEVSR